MNTNIFLKDVEEVIDAINQDSKASDFFLNGGCSKLVQYLAPLFIINKKEVKMAMFFYFRGSYQKQTLESLIKSISNEDLLIAIEKGKVLVDHIAIVNNNHIYDGRGVTEQGFYQEEYMLKDNFMHMFTFRSHEEVEIMMEKICKTHIFGNYKLSVVKGMITKLLKKHKKKKKELMSA